ncbi:hypothetical protein [Streptomyces lydicamycinicus]|uniref:hypothetical protein n=1 Tax=Streptomyces lydicamycinicus TaxID=1546107 RepID=UPI0005A6C19C|nr:hypothetical protein [Streptomyces lydicamycinicus]
MTGSVTRRAPWRRTGGLARRAASRRIGGLTSGGPLSPVLAVPAPPLSSPGPSSEQEPQA